MARFNFNNWSFLIRRHQKCAPNFPYVASRNDIRHKEYVRYAEHCLQMVATTTDQEARSIQREMAAEWLRLVDAADH